MKTRLLGLLAGLPILLIVGAALIFAVKEIGIKELLKGLGCAIGSVAVVFWTFTSAITVPDWWDMLFHGRNDD